ncbi:RagB/SusD family nutrient uptake outer membrane protein [Flavobacterium aquiphilum]|uniref:RagB/SusD family nutrient uptake outer membrane protein n=1 Tax=Flavobacterium aquiphilum TaxID=3003261 RepID=UPI00248140C0|nr:RagB/SusD family nutrient uptake outer membrane protein [Flavobacterium aquiphilum]
MKNSNIYKIVLGLLIVPILMISSCADLEEDLTGQPTADKFFNTITDFNSFLAGAYTPLIKLYGTDYPYVAGAGAEDVHTLVGRWKGLEQCNINSMGNPNEITDQLWNSHYSSISVCNTTLSLAGTSKLSTDQISPITGEAKFMRALNYFYLVRWFGEVPILTESNQIKASTEPQSSVSDIYKFIVSDLVDAELKLPSSQALKSRPTKWAAKALLSKVYLAMAGFPLNDTSKYTLARDKAKEVMDSGVYSLQTKFSDLWLWKNRLSNNEFIFTLYADVTTGTGSWVNRAVRPWDHGEGGWGDWESDKRFLAQFPVGERLNGTFYLTMIDGTNWQNTDYAQPYVGKLRDGGTNTGGYAGPPVADLADGFFSIIRYSDILLVYAEAANQADGAPSVAAYSAINSIRTRAGLSPISGLSKDSFDKAVLDERNMELAFENNRWFDLCRRHILKELMSVWYPNSVIDDHNYLLPKPTDQLAIMKGVKQNPGY